MTATPQTLYYRQQLDAYGEYLQQLGYSQSTQQHYKGCLKYFFIWLEDNRIRHARLIETDHIKEYRSYEEERPNQVRPGSPSASHIQTELLAIRLWIDGLYQTGQITGNPMSAIHIGRVKHEPRDILTLAEIKELYGTCRSLRERALLHLLYGCGLRRSEVIKLDLGDVHFKSGLLYVREGKGRKRRVIPMSDTVSQELRQYYVHERNRLIGRATSDNELAFMLGTRGNRITGCPLCRTVIAIAKRTTISKKITPHSLRHSIATHLLSAGMSLEYVREFLGHKHIDTTQIYTRITADQLKDF